MSQILETGGTACLLQCTWIKDIGVGGSRYQSLPRQSPKFYGIGFSAKSGHKKGPPQAALHEF